MTLNNSEEKKKKASESNLGRGTPAALRFRVTADSREVVWSWATDPGKWSHRRPWPALSHPQTETRKESHTESQRQQRTILITRLLQQESDKSYSEPLRRVRFNLRLVCEESQQKPKLRRHHAHVCSSRESLQRVSTSVRLTLTSARQQLRPLRQAACAQNWTWRNVTVRRTGDFNGQ